MNLSELENMSFLTQEALKDMPVEFDLDNEGSQVAKISFQDAVTLFEKGYKKGLESRKKDCKFCKGTGMSMLSNDIYNRGCVYCKGRGWVYE